MSKKSTAIVLYEQTPFYWEVLWKVPKQPLLPDMTSYFSTIEESEKNPYEIIPPLYLITVYKQNKKTDPKYLKKQKK